MWSQWKGTQSVGNSGDKTNSFYSKLCNLRPKVRTGQNLPHESPNFKNCVFLNHFMDNLGYFFHKCETTSPTFFLSKYIVLLWFSTLNCKMSWNMCVWNNKLCDAKTCIGPTFTWSNIAWYTKFTQRNSFLHWIYFEWLNVKVMFWLVWLLHENSS